MPRDRKGEFKPHIVPRYKQDVADIKDKVIAIYVRGMSTSDIGEHVKELYGIDMSAEMVSKITDRIIPEVKEW